jgi:hypothetical protein
MLKWLLCKLLGHRFVVKAYTGENDASHERARHAVDRIPLQLRAA